MSTGLLFWVLMLLWLVFGLWADWPGAGANPVKPLGRVIFLWVLLALLGWHVFGPALHS